MNRKLTKKILGVSIVALLILSMLDFGVRAEAATFGNTRAKTVSNTTNTTEVGGFWNNWAGYIKDGPIYSVYGYITVPQVSLADYNIAKNNLNGNYVGYAGVASWVGIGGVGNIPLIQDGVSSNIDINGRTSYNPWYEIVGVTGEYEPMRYISDFTIHPGDKIYTYVTIMSEGKGRTDNERSYKVAFGMRNITTQGNDSRGFYKEVEFYAPATLTSTGEWITEAPNCNNGTVNCPTFSTPGATAYGGRYISFQDCHYEEVINGSYSQIWNSTSGLTRRYTEQNQSVFGRSFISEVEPDSLGSTGNFNNVYYSWYN